MRKTISIATLSLLLCTLTACSVFASKRGFDRSMVDRNVQITAQHELDADPQLQGRAHIGTDVFNGVLLLIGEASTEEAKQRAQADVTGYQGVRKIVNLIDVMPLISVGRSALDATVTAGVKTALLGVDAPGFNPGQVKVSTAHGKVYLMGLVTHQEADAVAKAASHVAGVKKVVQVFQYTD